MNRLSQIIALIRTRNGLFVVVGILAVLNIGRFATSKYEEAFAGIESKQALHDQYKSSTQGIDSLRNRIKQLEDRRQQFDEHLFTGTSKKDISSAMQLKLQELLSGAGLNPESLRPLTTGGKKDEEKTYGEVVIKIRLTGELVDFVKFLASLYKVNYLFKIQNFTIKPFKKTQLKVFLELKGFYRLTEADDT